MYEPDLLEQAVADEVSDWLAAAKSNNAPAQLLSVKRATAIHEITDSVIGKLRMNLPQYIEAAAYNYLSQIIFARSEEARKRAKARGGLV